MSGKPMLFHAERYSKMNRWVSYSLKIGQLNFLITQICIVYYVLRCTSDDVLITSDAFDLIFVQALQFPN